jgi:DNA-binding MarR family transcriptional regulator
MNHALREFIRTFGLVERVMQPYFAQFGISGSQWGVLRNLDRAEAEGLSGLRVSELSERLLIRPPSVTGLIDRLERSGLVRRTAPQSDLRVRHIQLTPDGRALLRKILLVHDTQVNQVLAGLTPQEQTELARLLSTWGEHLSGMLNDCNVAAGTGRRRPVATGENELLCGA